MGCQTNGASRCEHGAKSLWEIYTGDGPTGGDEDGEMSWNRFESAKCRIVIRPTYDGNLVKPECLKLNGKVVVLSAAWLMDGADKYPGEWALMPEGIDEDFRVAGIGWIASGDVEKLPSPCLPGQQPNGT